jgi:hypothetical protein
VVTDFLATILAPEEPTVQHLIYGKAQESLNFSISTASLQNVPKPVLRRLASKGHQNGSVLMMENFKQFESMQRLKDFLESGRYRPFSPSNATVLEYVDEETGATKTWEFGNAPSLRAVKVTQTTQELFDYEMDFYFFAIEIGFDVLREESLSNIRKYPKSPRGIWSLVERLPKLDDSNLRQYTFELLDANACALTKLPEYLPFLKSMVHFTDQNRELGTWLLDKSTAANNQSSPKMNRRKASTHLNLEMSPDHLPALANAICNGRLIVTVEDGYGTLTGMGSGRNREFEFQAGEFMLLSDQCAPNGPNNCIVLNGKGQRGDIRRVYIREVPIHLGINDSWCFGYF